MGTLVKARARKPLMEGNFVSPGREIDWKDGAVPLFTLEISDHATHVSYTLKLSAEEMIYAVSKWMETVANHYTLTDRKRDK